MIEAAAYYGPLLCSIKPGRVYCCNNHEEDKVHHQHGSNDKQQHPVLWRLVDRAGGMEVEEGRKTGVRGNMEREDDYRNIGLANANTA